MMQTLPNIQGSLHLLSITSTTVAPLLVPWYPTIMVISPGPVHLHVVPPYSICCLHSQSGSRSYPGLSYSPSCLSLLLGLTSPSTFPVYLFSLCFHLQFVFPTCSGGSCTCRTASIVIPLTETSSLICHSC